MNTILQDLSEEQSKALDNFILAIRAVDYSDVIDRAEKGCLNRLKTMGFNEAADALEMDLQIPF